jgi:mediator of RNA polymerase II transcription subunit 5
MARSLSSFVPFLSHNSLGSQTSLEIANRLEMSQKQHELYEKPATIDGVQDENANFEVAALQLDSVMDLPMVSTRAGLYVFLNSLVCPAPLQSLLANNLAASCPSAHRRHYYHQLSLFKI